MELPPSQTFERVFPICRRSLSEGTWDRLRRRHDGDLESFPDFLAREAPHMGAPPFLADLARLELALYRAEESGARIPQEVDALCINPSLTLLQVSWSGLTGLLAQGEAQAAPPPKPEPELLMVWTDPNSRKTQCRKASPEDLLVLKMVAENIRAEDAASIGGAAIGALDAALDRAVYRGLLISPPSLVRREGTSFPLGPHTDQRFVSAKVFTLQWHITHACDLHCKHCYDRSRRLATPLNQGIQVLDDFREFCRSRSVRGQVSFSGGNPLLHPNFLELYRAAADRGLGTAVLGNPTSRRQLEELCAIQEPAFFQVSLEGLEPHNDYIRGQGFFRRVLDFLGLLKELNIFATVMLTLTRDNLDQVLPLGEFLRNRADLFVFNRLAMVGEGAGLESAPVAAYEPFLREYLDAVDGNPVLGLKDNLINILRDRSGVDLFGGCTGFGCGAAFNFVSLLPDGEVHACRKFPSLIGNLFQQRLSEIYDSPEARKYRAGCTACRDCSLRPACGGCLAVSHGFGLNPFEQRDPYCFKETRAEPS